MQDKFLKKIIAQNFNFIITGASGWIGKFLLYFLYSALKDDFSNRVFAISSSTKQIALNNNISVKTYDYSYDFPKNRNYVIIHLAFLTKDKLSTHSKEDYKNQNLEIRNNVVQLINLVKPKSLFYSSSGAIYSKLDEYGIEKLEDENFFLNLAKSHNFEIIIPRIFNIAGPYINKLNLYALSDFLMQAIKNNEININANNQVIRSYIYIEDLINICFSWIFDEDKKEKEIIFDTSNYDKIELFQLAKIIEKILKKPINIKRKNFNENLKSNSYFGNIETQQKLCDKYKINILNHEELIYKTYQYLVNEK